MATNTCEGLFNEEGSQLDSEAAKSVGPTTVTKTSRKRSGSLVIPATAKANLADPTMTVRADKPEQIKEVLKLFSSLDTLSTKPDTVSRILGERKSLLHFLAEDNAENIAVRSPLTVMNAAQRMLALIYSQGKKQVRLQLTGEEMTDYPFFSGGSDITNGFRVVDAERPISEFVNNLKAQARGDRSGSSIILLTGSHGTGKSETLKLLGIAAEKLTAQEDPKFASYTYAWTDLGNIPELRKFLVPEEVGGKKIYPNIEAPLGDSPLTLFPSDVQKLIVDRARASAETLIDGMPPAPFLSADPISHFIRNEIIQHYAKEYGHQLNAREIVDVLVKHTVVKRQILGQKYGRMPLIDASGNDIDVAGLFVAPNPVNRFVMGSTSHPMTWYLSGKLLSGHGNAVLFDEFFRNPQELRDMLLGAFESRQLAVNGAPVVPFDAVMIAATNTANLNEVRSKPAGAASADRFKLTPMRWSLAPNRIAELLLAQKSADLYQQNLQVEDAPIVRANIDELLPRVEGLARVRTSDYRYRLFFGSGSKKVEASPHTIMLMAEIIAATRFETDPSKAEREFKGKIIDSNLLKNPIDRLRLYEGLKPDVTADEIRELSEVSVLLNEGEAGISARDAGRWLTEALEKAATEKAGYTLTPGIVLRTFRSMLNMKSITAPSTKERLRWLDLSREIVKDMLVPRLDGDISRALAKGDRVVEDAYLDILDEMFALYRNNDATTYTSSRNGQEQGIQRDRLVEIEEIYLKKNGRPLNISQISIFHSRQRSAGEVGPVPDEALLEAIVAYYAKLNTQVAGFSALVEFERTGTGGEEVRWAHGSLVDALRRMGYNTVSIRDALMFVNDQRSRNQAK